jgi:tetratricopeptide (TPR) repeat protein
MLANERGERDQAIAFQEQALALYEAENDLFGMTYAHNALGETLCGRGDYTASREHYGASLKLSYRLGHQRGVAVALANMAQIETILGNYPAACQGFKESLQLFQEIGDRVNGATCLMGLGCVATVADSPAAWHQAAQLFGCGEHLLQETRGKLQPADRVIIDRHLALCRQKLGDAIFEAAWTAGQALSPEQAIACGLALAE